MKNSKIYIFDDRADIAESTKCFFESQNYLAVLLSSYKFDLTLPHIYHDDTVLIHLLDESPVSFNLLNTLISTQERPAIVLTTQFGAEIRPTDNFPGNRVKVLPHPFTPRDLMDAVRPH